MHISLRAVRDEDEDFLYRLYADRRRDEMAMWGWDAAQQNAFLKMQFRAQSMGYATEFPQADHQLILADGEPVGRMIVHRGATQTTLVDIAILSECRNRGIGANVIGNLIADCEASGKPLVLHVNKGNPAIHLYQRLGFLPDGEDELAYKMSRPTAKA